MQRGILERRRRGRAQRTRPIWLAAALIGCGGSNSAGGAPKWKTAEPTAPRTTGCIDTPFIGPDNHSTTSGVQCGREATPSAQLARGRVVGATPSGLPGPSLAGVWVTVHLVRGGLDSGQLPPVHAEVETGPQGEFVISVAGAEEVVLGVRTRPGGPVFAARRLTTSEPRSDLLLIVPAE